MLGSLELQTPVLSAPIAGFTDAIYRRTVRDLGGCGLLFTEMVWAGGWVQGKIEPDRLDGVIEEARPLGVQLWDREPAFLEEGARRLADMGVSLIDLNFGCPKKRIMGRHAAGATLLRDPDTVGRLVAAAVRGAGCVPVTAKIRLGPSLAACTAPEVARRIEENGAVGLTVHGRTADQHYGEPCHLDLIGEVVQAVSIPVIANGDVRDAASAARTLAATGAAGVMVARAALTRPWIFREIAAALTGTAVPPPPTAREQKVLLLKNHAALVQREGDPRGTILMRKFACRYISGAPGTHAFRDAICRAKDRADFLEIVERLFPVDDEWVSDGAAAAEVDAAPCG
jgi:tRNA-dihydrouridine synthase B